MKEDRLQKSQNNFIPGNFSQTVKIAKFYAILRKNIKYVFLKSAKCDSQRYQISDRILVTKICISMKKLASENITSITNECHE